MLPYLFAICLVTPHVLSGGGMQLVLSLNPQPSKHFRFKTLYKAAFPYLSYLIKIIIEHLVSVKYAIPHSLSNETADHTFEFGCPWLAESDNKFIHDVQGLTNLDIRSYINSLFTLLIYFRGCLLYAINFSP